MATQGIKRKRSAYDALFKLKVVDYAEIHGSRAINVNKCFLSWPHVFNNVCQLQILGLSREKGKKISNLFFYQKLGVRITLGNKFFVLFFYLDFLEFMFGVLSPKITLVFS